MGLKDNKSIVIAGVGGQGNILAAKVIAKACGIVGLESIVGEVFGVSQRGGSVASHVRFGHGVLSPISPEHKADVICGLEPMEALRASMHYIGREGTVVTNTRTQSPVGANTGKFSYPPLEDVLASLKELCENVVVLDATALAMQIGGTIFTNMVMLGAVSTVSDLNIPVDAYKEAILELVPRALDDNYKAFNLGREELLNIG